jgi:hypothetical protein
MNAPLTPPPKYNNSSATDIDDNYIKPVKNYIKPSAPEEFYNNIKPSAPEEFYNNNIKPSAPEYNQLNNIQYLRFLYKVIASVLTTFLLKLA